MRRPKGKTRCNYVHKHPNRPYAMLPRPDPSTEFLLDFPVSRMSMSDTMTSRVELGYLLRASYATS